ncbi:hypothetical protein [Leifsonia sp. 21MFCrub1.1]|uniref:hypothetical protein n=1 Tax=Leifsonia sp. 21MFCrub1.1 TaxID=1798223 RepID=UPI0012FD1B52|nr:hypothetical protein [Leifsonia sp. 21MFCrub1.1]
MDYWAIDVPNLSDRDARKLVKYASSLGYDGDVLSPSIWLTWALDRGSVAMLRSAAKAGLASESGRWSKVEIAGVESMISEMDDWLSATGEDTGPEITP